jgi:hypothetical protein
MNTPLLPRFSALCLATLVGACAVAPTAPSVMVLPGSQKSQSQFQADAADCQAQAQAQLAPDAQAVNNQAVANAAIGTAIGAAAGALFGYGGYSSQSAAWGAGTGLLIGGAMGSGNSQMSSYGLQQRFDIVYMQCMYLRGNQVPGQASFRRQAPAVAPPAPNQPAPVYRAPNTAPSNIPPPDTPPPIGAVPPA